MSRPLGLGLLLLGLVCAYAAAELVGCEEPSGRLRFAEGLGARKGGEDAWRGAPVARDRVAPGDALPAVAELGPGWEAVEEVPSDPRADPQLRRWGVRTLRTRHYAQRGAPGSSRVCSVEVWVFGDAADARAAQAEYAPPRWQVEREGRLLVLAHGVTLTLGEPFRPGLFPDCLAIAERARALAADLVGESAGVR